MNGIDRLLEAVDFQGRQGAADALDNRDFRASYVAHSVRAFLADQVRVLRGDRSQKIFGEIIGKPQSVISRLENEEYGKVTLQTLLDIAERLDIALVVRFVDFPTYIQRNTDFSDAAAAPRSYRETNRHMTLTEHNIQDEPSTALRAFLKSSYEQTFSSSLTKAVNEQNGAQNRATGWINQYRQLSGDRTNAANKLSQFSQSVDVLETHYVNNAREHAA